MHRPLAALILALALLAAHSSALAQSAGDDQYDDPFGGGGGGQQEEPAPAPEPTPAPAGEPAPAAPAPAATAEPTTDPGTPAPAETPAAGGGGEQLPRTGAPTALVVGAGAMLLLGGLLLRRRTLGDRR